MVVNLYTAPPADGTLLYVDELGPVTPRTFRPAPGLSPDGHRIKAPLDDGRGPDKAWVYGARSPRDGQALTMTAPARNSDHYCAFLEYIVHTYPVGPLFIITDNLSSHTSLKTRTWLADHPRVQQVFIPKGAAWLNLQEGWWRLLRREALAGRTFADHDEIAHATALATRQLNHRAQPWLGLSSVSTALLASPLCVPYLRNVALSNHKPLSAPPRTTPQSLRDSSPNMGSIRRELDSQWLSYLLHQSIFRRHPNYNRCNGFVNR